MIQLTYEQVNDIPAARRAYLKAAPRTRQPVTGHGPAVASDAPVAYPFTMPTVLTGAVATYPRLVVISGNISCENSGLAVILRFDFNTTAGTAYSFAHTVNSSIPSTQDIPFSFPIVIPPGIPFAVVCVVNAQTGSQLVDLINITYSGTAAKQRI